MWQFPKVDLTTAVFVFNPYYQVYMTLTSSSSRSRSSQQFLFEYNVLTPAAPERQPTTRGRATVPRRPHTAALGVAGERTSANARLGERGF